MKTARWDEELLSFVQHNATLGRLHRSAIKKLHRIFLLFLIDFYSLKPETIVKKFFHVNFFCKTHIFSLILCEISLQHEIWYPIVDSKNHI
jgi:hypothetical protein